MMQSLRKQAKGFLAFILFGLLILSFAIWGIGDIFRPVSGRTVVVSVGDLEIPAEQLTNEVQREIAALRARSGVSLDYDQAIRLGLVNQVVNRVVGTALLDMETRDLGLAASDRLVGDAVTGDEVFQNQFGRFDRARYRALLARLGMSERMYEETLRGDLARRQLAAAVSAGEKVPKALSHALYRHRQERRVADVAFIANDSITGVPAPSDAELAKFHADNQARFMAPEYRKVTAVIIRPDDLAADIEVGEEALRDAFEARRGEFESPERRQVEQLLFRDEETAKAAYARIADGEDFAAVGKDVLGQEPTALGTVVREDLVLEALAEAAFALDEGAVSTPVRTDLGWHILRVRKVEPGRTKSFDEVREQLLRDVKHERAVDAAIELGEDLDKEVGSGAGIAEAAQKFGLPLTRIEAIDAKGRNPAGEPVAGLPEGSTFLSQVFELGEGEDGLLSDAEDGSYFILRVDRVTPTAVRPLTTIRDQVAAAWTAERRSERARQAAEDLAARAGGGDLADIAKKAGRTVRTTDPFTRTGDGAGEHVSGALVEKLFAAREGEAVWAPTRDGYVVGAVREVEPANPLADSKSIEALNAQLREAIAGDLIAQLTGALRERYPVDIDRPAIDDVFTRR